jgi:hypothetical protein
LRRLNRLLLDNAFPLAIRSTVSTDPIPGTATVYVRRTERPVVLVLTAHEPVRWIVKANPGVKIHQVILGGYQMQEVTGVEAPVLYRTRVFGDRTGGEHPPFYASEQDDERYPDLVTKLRELTGLEITTFQGRPLEQEESRTVIMPRNLPQYDPRPFVIGSKE